MGSRDLTFNLIRNIAMSNEVYNLTWNEFGKCTGMASKDLLEEKDFFDVTLVSKDREKISAHKVVLSSCSPILRKMLMGTPQHQPVLLFPTGIQFSEISSLLKFMYLGETNILQEDLDRFIDIGRKLKVKGLTDPFDNTNNQSVSRHVVNDDDLESPTQSSVKGEIMPFDILDHSADVEAGNNPDQLQQDAANSYISELGTSDNCAQYGKIGNVFSCDKCEYRAKWAQKMKLHIDAKHNNVKYSCELCAYSSGYPHHLYTHKKTKHSFT